MLCRHQTGFRLLVVIGLLTFAPCATSAKDLSVTGRITVIGPASRDRSTGDAVVWLTPVGESAQTAAAARLRPTGHYQLVQRGRRFRPHILVVPVGAAVDFPNRDPFFHNVFSLFDGKRFDLGLYEAGSTKTVTFNSPGVSYIFCNIHPEMSAVVVAIKTPYYALSGPDGSVVIDDVPPGRYEINIWHERCLPETLKALVREVTLTASSSSLGDIPLKETSNLLAKHKNKYGRDYDASVSPDSTYTEP